MSKKNLKKCLGKRCTVCGRKIIGFVVLPVMCTYCGKAYDRMLNNNASRMAIIEWAVKRARRFAFKWCE